MASSRTETVEVRNKKQRWSKAGKRDSKPKFRPPGAPAGTWESCNWKHRELSRPEELVLVVFRIMDGIVINLCGNQGGHGCVEGCCWGYQGLWWDLNWLWIDWGVGCCVEMAFVDAWNMLWGDLDWGSQLDSPLLQDVFIRCLWRGCKHGVGQEQVIRYRFREFCG